MAAARLIALQKIRESTPMTLLEKWVGGIRQSLSRASEAKTQEEIQNLNLLYEAFNKVIEKQNQLQQLNAEQVEEKKTEILPRNKKSKNPLARLFNTKKKPVKDELTQLDELADAVAEFAATYENIKPSSIDRYNLCMIMIYGILIMMTIIAFSIVLVGLGMIWWTIMLYGVGGLLTSHAAPGILATALTLAGGAMTKQMIVSAVIGGSVLGAAPGAAVAIASMISPEFKKQRDFLKIDFSISQMLETVNQSSFIIRPS
jgi:hypothetical protein